MKNQKRLGASYFISRLVLILLLVTTFFPFIMMINMSLKPTVLISTEFPFPSSPTGITLSKHSNL
jgi:ABC-type glycerol-3-phosphate transport system permease component